MFTQNYINHMYNRFFAVYYGSSGDFTGKKYTDTTGVAFTGYAAVQMIYVDIGNAMRNPVFSATYGGGIYFGTGSTPATVNDYQLESPIASGIELVHKAVSVVNEAEGRYSVCGQYTLKNTSGQPINIYEIGCFASVPNGQSTNKSVMLERTVLTEPIAIGRDEAKTITYKITFNQTLNVEQ